jgi:hypothetical protein
VREALCRRGLTSLARLLDGLYAAGLAPGWTFTAQEAAEAHGRMSYRTIRRVLTKITETTQQQEPHNNANNELLTVCDSVLFFFASHSIRHKLSKIPTGRPAQRYRLPAPGEVARWLGVVEVGDDVLPAWAFESDAKYRAALHRELIARRPGVYSRAWLGSRLGVGRTATRHYESRYAELADVHVEQRWRVVHVDIAELPEYSVRDGAPVQVRVRSTGEVGFATQRRVKQLLERHTLDELEFFQLCANDYSIRPGDKMGHSI